MQLDRLPRPLRYFFQPIEVRPFEFQFCLDRDPNGAHLARAYLRTTGDTYLLIKNLPRLWEYGFLHESKFQGVHLIQVVSEEDRQTLLALKSLHPVQRPDGDLEFEVEPNVLRYLRGRHNLTETPASQSVRIADTPLRPVLQLDYDPNTGLKYQIGYILDETGGLTPLDSDLAGKDGRYVQSGDLFTPLAAPSPGILGLLGGAAGEVPLNEIPAFYLKHLPVIKEEFDVQYTPAAQTVQVVSGPHPAKVQVDIDDLGWLNFSIAYQAAEASISYHTLLAASNQESLQVDTNTWFMVDSQAIQDTQQKLAHIEAILTDTGYRLPVYEFAWLEEFICDIGGHGEYSQACQHFLDELTTFQPSPDFRLSEPLEAVLKKRGYRLRAYQRIGVHWLDWLRRNRLHGLLADEPGLGKTLQALCAMRLGYEHTQSRLHSLIIASESKVLQWESELKNSFPLMRVYLYHGPARKKSIFSSKLTRVIITTYTAVAEDVQLLSRVPFYYLILDEIDQVAQHHPACVRSVQALHAQHRLSISDSPLEGHPSELWTAMDCIMPGHLGPRDKFVGAFEAEILTSEDWAIHPLGRRLRPFILRRNRQAVAGELPDRIVIKEWCGLTTEQTELYNRLQAKATRIRRLLRRDEPVNYPDHILPTLTYMKQVCNHPALRNKQIQPLLGRSVKFDWIIEKTQSILLEGGQVAIYSQFSDMLSLLAIAFQGLDIPYVRMDTTTQHHRELVDQFNQHKVSVALLSLMVGDAAATLTAASHAIHADRWWNPAVEDMVNEGLQRPAPDQTVYIYYILTMGTIEERLERLLETRRSSDNQKAESAFEGGSRWTRDELLRMLRPLE